jgi:hypothetical protein
MPRCRVCTVQALLFVPVIYSMIGFSMVAEKAFYYGILFLASISFYTIFGQFMVYVTPSQQIAQVRWGSQLAELLNSTTCVACKALSRVSQLVACRHTSTHVRHASLALP